MNTVILPSTEEGIAKAAGVLKRGELVGIPTETVYGLAANALDEQAVLDIFAAKGRPADNPLIVHVATIEDAQPLCEIDDRARLVMQTFCPGALTVLLPRKKCIHDVVTAGLSSVAIRIPSHPVAQKLLQACELPLAAPSANTSGRPSPTTAQHVWEDMQGKIPLILDGGACEVGLESTVLDLTKEVPMILRPGGVTPQMLQTVLPTVCVADSVMRPLQKGEVALSPGMRYRHYAPKGEVSLVSGKQENVQKAICTLYDRYASTEKVCILAFEEHRLNYEKRNSCSIGTLCEPETVAQRLFDVLRQMDQRQFDRIFCEVLPAQGIGLAIMNRLNRAASFHVMDADGIMEDENH